MTLFHLQERAYWVIPGKFMAGGYAGDTTDEEAREKIAWLSQQGVNVFIDLTWAGELRPYADLLPDQAVYHRMEIVDMGIPTTVQMTAVLDTIDAALEQGKTVYAHCWAGRGRTGTVVGCYLARHGMTGDQALAEIARLRNGQTDSPEALKQYDFVRDWREGQ